MNRALARILLRRRAAVADRQKERRRGCCDAWARERGIVMAYRHAEIDSRGTGRSGGTRPAVEQMPLVLQAGTTMKSTMTAAGLLGFAALVSSSSQSLISAETNPKAVLQQARNDLRGQHFAEAAAEYDKVIADSSKDAAKYKPDALYE